MIDPCMYLFVNKGLDMTPGKIASQAHHAAVLSWELTPAESNLRRLYLRSGHYKTITLIGDDENHMRNIHEYLTARDVQNVMIIDEGHTEVSPFSITAIGTEVVDKNHPHISGIFEGFKLYNDSSPRVAFKEGVKWHKEWTEPPLTPKRRFSLRGRGSGLVEI